MHLQSINKGIPTMDVVKKMILLLIESWQGLIDNSKSLKLKFSGNALSKPLNKIEIGNSFVRIRTILDTCESS